MRGMAFMCSYKAMHVGFSSPDVQHSDPCTCSVVSAAWARGCCTKSRQACKVVAYRSCTNLGCTTCKRYCVVNDLGRVYQ